MLNMSSDPGGGDLTARATIRNTALRLFAERGHDAVTMREIAAAAGVSPALLVHHFGSKEGLRAAVDEYAGRAFDALFDMDEDDLLAVLAGERSASLAELFASSFPLGSPLPAYLRRLLLTDDPAGAALFATWFRGTRRLLDAMAERGATTPTADPDVRAAFLLANDLALLLLRPQISTALGVDPLSPGGLQRWVERRVRRLPLRGVHAPRRCRGGLSMTHPAQQEGVHDTPIVRAEGLVKTFGDVHALDGLDLTVTRGEVHGFLGPNGAGKSTTIRILLGLLRATEGRIELFGEDPWRHAPRLHARLAYVAGDVALWPGLTGGQCLDILGSTHGGVDPARRDQLVDRFELDPTKRVRDYSKGNRQKVALVAALAAEAELLILDEPTSGLDPLMEQAFQECIRERRDAGVTVLLSSHIMAEVEALADRVSIIRRGRNVTTGTLPELRRHTRTNVHAVTDDEPALTEVDGLEDLATERLDGHVDSRFTVGADQVDEAVGRLHAARIQTLTVTPPSLGALFLRTYGEALDESEEADSASVEPGLASGAAR